MSALGRKPIHQAVQYGSHAVVDQLVTAHNQANTTDRQGWTPLHYAAARFGLHACMLTASKC